MADADHQRLFQANFRGLVHGSLLAPPHLKTLRGVLYTGGSPHPLTTAAVVAGFDLAAASLLGASRRR